MSWQTWCYECRVTTIFTYMQCSLLSNSRTVHVRVRKREKGSVRFKRISQTFVSYIYVFVVWWCVKILKWGHTHSAHSRESFQFLKWTLFLVQWKASFYQLFSQSIVIYLCQFVLNTSFVFNIRKKRKLIGKCWTTWWHESRQIVHILTFWEILYNWSKFFLESKHIFKAKKCAFSIT